MLKYEVNEFTINKRADKRWRNLEHGLGKKESWVKSNIGDLDISHLTVIRKITKNLKIKKKDTECGLNVVTEH